MVNRVFYAIYFYSQVETKALNTYLNIILHAKRYYVCTSVIPNYLHNTEKKTALFENCSIIFYLFLL